LAKLSEDRKPVFLELFTKNFGNIQLTCDAFHITRQCFYQHYKDDGDFRIRVDNIREGIIDFAESVLHRKIKEGSTPELLFFLKCRAKSRGYVERTEIDHTTKGEQIGIPKLTVPQIKEILKNDDSSDQ